MNAKNMSRRLAFLAAVLSVFMLLTLTVVLYFLFSCLFGVLKEKDLAALPVGKKLIGLLDRVRKKE